MFPNILPVYFLLMCKVSNPNFCLFKFAKRLFHWKTIIILSLLYLCFLLLLHGDTESKLYPRNSKNHLPSFCQWNLNSLPEYNFAEMVFFKHMMLCIQVRFYMFVWTLFWFHDTVRSCFLRFGQLKVGLQIPS